MNIILKTLAALVLIGAITAQKGGISYFVQVFTENRQVKVGAVRCFLEGIGCNRHLYGVTAVAIIGVVGVSTPAAYKHPLAFIYQES